MDRISRRNLLASLAAMSGSAAFARIVSGQSANVDVETVTYRSGQFDVAGHLARPKTAGRFPAVILVHDNRGLTPHLRTVAQRFASEGFVALAPDLLSRLGGSGQARQPSAGAGDTTGESNRIGDAQAIARLPMTAPVEDLRAGLDYLGTRADVDAMRLSAVGFAWGGWRTFMLATSAPTLRKAVVFYSASPDTGFDRIQASVLAHYAEWDNQVTGNALWTKEMMERAGKTFRFYVYPKTDAAFFNDTAPSYSAEAARLAWQRTIDFLKS